MIAKWAIVQHSAVAAKGDMTFERALETRMVSKDADARKVEKAGGILFDSYADAEDFTEVAMYPPGNDGLIPNVLGKFSDETLDGMRIYIPVREVKG